MVTDATIWLVGCRGMLGRQLERAFERNLVPHVGSDREVDICDVDALRRFARDQRLGWIVNCAAYTAVDAAENDPGNAFAANARGPENLARVAKEKHCPLLHISTDYVFDGQKTTPYDEGDTPCPESVYGASKRAGEEAVMAESENHLILRISWLYGVYGRNFVETMIRLFQEKGKGQVVIDQIGAPTYAAVLADNIVRLIGNPRPSRGVFHYADEGEISWYDFASAIATEALAGGQILQMPIIAPIASSDYPQAAKRPANSRFDKTKVKNELEFEVLPWRRNLGHYFEERRILHAEL